MRVFSKGMKRILSIVLAVCMVWSIVAYPGSMLITNANSEGESTSNLISKPVYSHGMDTLNGGSDAVTKFAPSGWSNSNAYGNLDYSEVVAGEGNNSYYMMKGPGSSRHTLLNYTFTAENAPGANAVLKYRLMVNNSALSADWRVEIPIFANAATERTLGLGIVNTGTAGVYSLTDGTTSVEWREGQWYDVELVVSNDGQAWALLVNGNTAFSGTIKAAYALKNTHLNMGTAANYSANTSFCVDDLGVYTYVANATFGAAQPSYKVDIGNTVTPGWTKTEGAYLPSVAYSSSDNTIATVDNNGVVTGLKKGTVTITATPPASTGMSPATTMVTVENANDPTSKPVYIHGMDAVNGGSDAVTKFAPLGWSNSNTYGNLDYSEVVAGDGDNSYYMMKGPGSSRNTLLHYTFTTENAPGANAVLKYRMMVNNSSVTTDWRVEIPIFANGATERTLSLGIVNTSTAGVYSLTDGATSVEWREGQWYDIELIVSNDGQAWALLVDGNTAFSGTLKATYALQNAHLNMGTAANKSANASMCVDDIAVYTYAANATLSAVQSVYEVAIGSKVFPAWVKTEGAYLPSVTYTSSDNTIATVDENGMVTGLQKGTVTITATPPASTGMSPATTKVMVKNPSEMIPVTGVTINGGADTAVISVGKKLPLVATITPAEATGKVIKWTSDDPTTVAVDEETGVVTAVKPGTAVVTASVVGSGISDTINIMVASGAGVLSKPVYQNAMDIIDARENLYPLDWNRASGGQNALASQIILPTAPNGRQYYQMKRSGSEGDGISWVTSNPVTDYSSVVLKYDVMVDNGDLTGWSVLLPEFSDSSKSRPIGITVKENKLEGTEITLVPGTWYTFELILSDADWMLFVNGEKARWGILPDGTTIACLNMGIMAAGGNPTSGQTEGANVAMNLDDMAIYSYVAPSEFAFAKPAYEVVVGKTIATAWKLDPNNAYLPFVTYKSSDETVATVNADGIITGVAAGTAVITATPAPSTGLAPVTTTVTVKSADGVVNVTDVVINETNVTVRVGDQTTLTATVNPESATVKGVHWYTDNPAVAVVDMATGVVTGVSAGTANIIVTTDDGGKIATVSVTVTPIYATGVVIYDGVDTATVTAGKSIAMYATVTPAGATNRTVKWSSSDPSVARVDADSGVVTGVKAGVAVITATVDGTAIVDTITVLVAAPRTESCAGILYENTMDALNADGAGDVRYPAGWARENTIAKSSKLVTFGGRTYWQMKNDANGIDSSAYAVYTFTNAQGAESPLSVTPVSLKYSVMVDNKGEGWITYLPAFANAKRGRLFALNIQDNVLVADRTTMPIESGKWYDIEVLVESTSWTVFVDGGKVASGALDAAVTSVAYINTGIYAKGSVGNTAANIGINIDDLTVHAHNQCTYSTYKNAAFEKTSYRYTSGGTFTPVLKNLPAGTSVTYASSNKDVATVDASGKVTVTGTVGTAMILAYVDGCTLPVASAVVKCTGRFNYFEDFENGLNGWGIRISCGNGEYQSLDTVKNAFGSNANNHAMAVKAIAQSGSSMRALYFFKDEVVLDRAVIRYDFKLDSNMGVVFLPGFTNGVTGLVGQLAISYESLLYWPNGVDWEPTGVSIESGVWHTLEQVVDTVSGVYDLYIDGELVMVQTPIVENCAPFNGLYVGMFKVCTNTQFIDNIQVYEGIDPVTAIRFKQNAYTVAVGPKATALEVELDYTGNTYRSVKYISSDESVATVDAFGNITGHKNGTVTITAVPYGNTNLSATTTVTVIEKPVTSIGANNVNLHVGGHVYINPVITPSDAGFKDMLYTSSNKAVATVDEWGEIVAVGKGTAQITITSAKYPSVKKVITVTVADMAYQSTIYVSVSGGGNGSSKNSPMTLEQAMQKVATMDKSRGSVVVELAGGYYTQTRPLNFAAAHGGNNDNFVIYRAESGADVTIGGAEFLDNEIVSGFTKVEGKNYYVMQLNKDINTRHLIVNGVRAIRARSKAGLTDAKLISSDGLSYQGFSCTDTDLLKIPADDHADLEFSYSVEWGNHRGGVVSISQGDDGRVNLIMEQPNFQTITAHSNISVKELENPSRPYSMFYENALILLDEPGEWYFDNEEKKLYYMPYAWENINNLSISYPVIDDWTQRGMTEASSGLINILGDDSGIVQNIKFEGITFADTTYGRTNSNVGMSASQGMHIRDFNSTSADVQPDAAITLERTNSIYFTDCEFTRLGITGINMWSGTQNVQIVGCTFADISGNGLYIGHTNWRKQEVYNPSDPLLIVKNCDVYNCYMHDMGTEYESASAIAVGYAAYVNLENNEIFNVAYSPLHIGMGWEAKIDNVIRHTTIANNFIHDFNFGGVWDSGAIYLNGLTSGNVNPFTGEGNNIVSGNYIRNMGVGTGAVYNDGGASDWIWENNVVDLSETPLWPNAFTPNGAQWLVIGESNYDILLRNNYTSHTKTYGEFPRASGKPHRIQAPYNEADLNDNNNRLVFQNNIVCEDLNWPVEARNIMASAGLTVAFAYLRNNHPERIDSDLPDLDEDILVMGVGSTFDINLRATDGKGNAVDVSKSTVAYVSDDESVVTVSASGVITATGKGDTVVRVYVWNNGIVQVLERPVSVGTDLVDIYIEQADEEGTLTLATNGDSVMLKPFAVTERGIHLTPDSVKYEVGDSTIVRLKEDNSLLARKEGETTLKVTVVVKDQAFTKTFKLKVMKPVSFELDDLEEIFKRSSISGWKNSMMKLSIVQDKELLIQGTGTGYTTFAPTKYLNELFCFEFALTADSPWPSFALRVQGEYSYVAAGATGYLICFTKEGVQLQRFNRNERTVLYGYVEGFDSVYGSDIPFFLNNNQVYKIQVGALTNGTKVHLFLSVDGQVIFNCVDKGEGAITDAGYFGVVGKEKDVFRLIKAQDLSQYSLPKIDVGSVEDDGGEVLPGTPGTGGDTTDGPGGPDGPGNSNKPGNNNKPNKPGNNDKPGGNDKNPGGDDSSNGQNAGNLANNKWILPVVIISVLVIAGGGLAWFFLYKKRRQKKNQETSEEQDVQVN